nr:deoxyribodipyrimidine photo-lyase/cryptochrome family protein [uncultured Albidiferax sp.]
MSVLVWLKKDLRSADHAPLAAAAALPGAALALYVIEPEWLASPECDAQHVEFTLACLAELRPVLAARGLPLLVRVGPVLQVFAELQRSHGIRHLLSHEETGPGWTYARDLAVADWCRAQGVQWQEFAHTGVIRRLRSRNGWAARWQQRMAAPQVAMPSGWAGARVALDDLPTLAQLGCTPHGRQLQAAGEAAAHATLYSFLHQRGSDYRQSLSSPLTAEDGCSRLSPHLAFGTLSVRQVHQATEARIAQIKAEGDPDARHWVAALRGFSGRLHWHCHFMQKLEDAPRIEFQNFARVCDGLRENAFDAARFDAWCAGQTGYPMVDACMRSLRATGWLNFRMRAMLVSFASYHLWLHWRATGLFLARQFLDFEPGIHWSQMQMQSGTTGINTLRIYSPTKQAQDHDPAGVFIRRWVPELAQVPLALLATPWRMGAAQQRAVGCVIGQHYPAPIVDDAVAVKAAKERLYGLRSTATARAEADGIQARHGSRKAGLPRTGMARKPPVRAPKPSPQLDLFGD